ncbi:MAG: hypothetical protein H5T62_17830 [Anaerolineae bacterium]|nr:hypothetical protein [Anaerolineae bacterium]
MLDWRDVLFQRERYRDLRREARAEQLSHRAQAHSTAHLYAPLLHHLGQKLVAWGLYLQQHSNIEGQHAPTLASCQSRPGGRF